MRDRRRSMPLILVVRQHALDTLNTLTEAVLEPAVAFPFLDVSCDCQTDHLRNRLPIDIRYRVQFLRLVGRQANCHRLDWFHAAHCAIGVEWLSSCYQVWYVGGTIY